MIPRIKLAAPAVFRLIVHCDAKLFDRNLRFAAGRNPVGHFQQLSQRNEFSINLNHRQSPFPPAAYQKNYTTKLTKNHNFPIK